MMKTKRMASATDTPDTEFAGIRLTSPGKILFGDKGVSKRDLAAYLTGMADRILPHVSSRPLSLVRCPDGYEDGCFFQKHGMAGFPKAFRRVQIREKDGDPADYLYVADAAGLAAAAQMGALELHIWGAHIDRLERPDRLVFDLDPAGDVPFSAVKQAASDLRTILNTAGLDSFPLLTGGKGLHVVAPLERRQGWDEVKRFAAGLARALSASEPDRFTAQASMAERKGRIFIDWLRNERGATAIAPFSPRAKKGAPVATPVSWSELDAFERSDAYRLDTITPRLEAMKHDPWQGYGDIRQSIRKQALQMAESGKILR